MATPAGKRKISSKDTNNTVTVHCDGDDGDLGSALTTTTTEPTTSPDRASKESHGGSSHKSSKLTFDEVLLKEDTLIIMTYVKEEMDYGVKFLYDPKHDLATGGLEDRFLSISTGLARRK